MRTVEVAPPAVAGEAPEGNWYRPAPGGGRDGAGEARGREESRGWRVTIGMKLLGGFLGLALLLAALGIFSAVQLGRVNEVAVDIATNGLPSVYYLSTFDAATTRFRAAQLAHNLSSDPAEQAADERDMASARQAADDALKQYEPLATTPTEQAALPTIKQAWATYEDDSDRRFLPLSRANRHDEAAAYLQGDGKKLFASLDASLSPLIAFNVRESQDMRAQSAAVFANSQRLIAVAIGVALLVAVGLGLLLSRSIGRGVRQVTAAASGLARGELDQRVDVRSRDEIGQMADAFRATIAYLHGLAGAADAIGRGDLTTGVRPHSSRDVLGVAFERMAVNLRTLVAELQEGSHNLASAGSEILAATSRQAAGTTEQSAAIAQTTATVTEVRASAEQAVQLAETVSEATQQANRVSGDGVSAVREAIDGMADIRQKVQSIAENILALSEQGQQIGEIIAAVNDLADQSNLLALNAAIEAGRAGEHGKGFAVVAQEIRALAEQSKAATAQVRTILSDIQRATNAAVLATEQGTKGVDTGTQLIDQAGRTIDELAEVIEQTAQAAAQIAASVRQHAVGMEQIAAAMGNTNQAATQNLAATRNTQQAAENLNDLAGRFNQLIAQYQA
ncbi:MAG TPA: methyl-accepting chemotaxis protein [Thermomicrobiales bacterium]|nr:methyl-accepting chemotaxis protein [Thermomicrobiales bacterium]